MKGDVIVTGGAGYVGSHACKALARAGYRPITLDNFSTGNRWAVRYGPLEVADTMRPDQLDAIFTRWQPLAVMHFAAVALVGESMTDPALYYRQNVTGTLNLLDRTHLIAFVRVPVHILILIVVGALLVFRYSFKKLLT